MIAAPADGAGIRQVAEALHRGEVVTIAGRELCSGRLLHEVYLRSDFAPVWSRTAAADLAEFIREVGTHGLRAEDYHASAIDRLRTGSGRGTELDLLLSDAFLLLGGDLLRGRVDPRTLTPTWCLPPREADLIGALEAAASGGEPIARVLGRLAPAHHAYQRLREALSRYREIRARGAWERIPAGPTLRPGDDSPRVESIRRRLQASGDLPLVSSGSVIDPALERAIRQFQRLHGLEEDGIVGPQTLREMDVTVDERIDELELNLERMRWIPDVGSRFAVVNIAAFEMVVVEAGAQALRMRVVVGEPFQKTPVFSSAITEVIFSPYWNVPQSIAARELWPRERREPGYLAQEHIRVLASGRLRQDPGPWNALGRVKFFVPNEHDVYLHDTPATALFSLSSRAFSHGCMRLEKPLELAEWLLRDDPRWTHAAIAAAAEVGREQRVRLRSPLPLHVLYSTAWVEESGELHFRRDVYDRNPALRLALTR